MVYQGTLEKPGKMVPGVVVETQGTLELKASRE